MLFNSLIFLFGFLPIALVLTYGAGRFRTLSKIILTLLSLIFYAWLRPIYLPLLLGSIVFNYVVGAQIQRAFQKAREAGLWLGVGVTANLALLGWYKYANFVVVNINDLTGANIALHKIALPLAISFFTFQNIAYLVDSARGEAKKISFLDFSLFSAFFPKLISGPLVHFKELVPQLQSRRFGRLVWRNILIGLVILSIGLFKKTAIADTLGYYTDPLFAKAASGQHYSLSESWLAAVSYTFQLYFDFSGYSDMAIGLARMLGVKLPLNFHSPLRSPSIIDYWRRWHMTLQRLIVLYVFQPLALALNRQAAYAGLQGWSAFAVAVGLPTLATFVVVGIWHGAGWTFVLFGVMHAIYVCGNEIWRERRRRLRRSYRRTGRTLAEPGNIERLGYHALTLVAVMFANVLFRAQTISDAARIWAGMCGLGDRTFAMAAKPGLVVSVVVCAAIVFLLPNTQQIMGRFQPAYNWAEWRDTAQPPIRWTWRPTILGLLFAGVALFMGVVLIQRGQAVFLYFNF